MSAETVPEEEDEQTDDEQAPFSATIQANVLEDFLGYIRAVVDEARVQLADDGLIVRGVDAANVAMGDVSLDSNAFESYQTNDRKGRIGMNLERFQEVVGFGDSGSIVRLRLDAETRKMNISVDGLEYTLALIDPESIRQEPDIPDIDLPAMIRIESRQLKRAQKAADLVSDHLRFEVQQDPPQFRISASGDTDEVEVILGEDDLLDGGEQINDDVVSLFSMEYIKNILKPLASKDEINIDVGDEFPVRIQSTFADGDGEVLYMIAPRVEN